MKKFYLLVGAAIAGISAMGQQNLPTSPANKQSVKYNPKTNQTIHFLQSEERKSNLLHAPYKMTSNEEELGITQYDLQSNGSVCPRIIADANGVAATWTFSVLNSSNTYPDRGTGYNYRNGTTNSWDEFPSARIENIRTGWSNLLHPANGSEVVIAHSGTGGVKITSRSAVGTGSWSQAVEIPTNTNTDMLWPRACTGGTNGNTIHMIALTNPDDILYNTLDSKLLYYRSLDAGTTWDIIDGEFPWMDSTHIADISADSYAITCRGNKVVVALFGELSDTYIYVSDDNGNTWSREMIMETGLGIYSIDDGTDTNQDGVVDTVLSTDGAGAVYIDNSNVVHLAFGTMFYMDDLGVVDSVYSYFPINGSIAYWNSTMVPDVVGVDSTYLGQELGIVSIDTTFNTYEVIDQITPIYAPVQVGIDTTYTLVTESYYVYDTTFVQDVFTDVVDLGSGDTLVGDELGAPSSILWQYVDVDFLVDDPTGIQFTIDGFVDTLMAYSGSIDITNVTTPNMSYMLASPNDSIILYASLQFMGYFTGDQVDFIDSTLITFDTLMPVYTPVFEDQIVGYDTTYMTVNDIVSIDTTFGMVDVWDVVNLTNYNNSIVEIGVSPDTDPAAPAATTEVGQYGNSGVASHPQLAGDDAGNLYVTYMAVNETFFNGQEYLRHIWAVKSADGGLSWSANPADITPDLAQDGWEYTFASTYNTLVNDRLHVVIQRDDEPGLHVVPEDTADPVSDNTIIYLAITSDLVATFNSGVSEDATLPTLNAYPNPASNLVTLSTTGMEGATYRVVNITGELVTQGTIKGERTKLNAEMWSSGLYQIVVTQDGQSYSIALVKE